MSSVLLIDDEQSSCQAVAALLRREGVEVACAPTAMAALSQLRQAEPDLVVLDLGMPRTDGLELLDALMDEPRFRHLRVVVFSGRCDPQTVDLARRLGAADFIEKGSPRDEVRSRLLRAVVGARPGRAAAAGQRHSTGTVSVDARGRTRAPISAFVRSIQRRVPRQRCHFFDQVVVGIALGV